MSAFLCAQSAGEKCDIRIKHNDQTVQKTLGSLVERLLLLGLLLEGGALARDVASRRRIRACRLRWRRCLLLRLLQYVSITIELELGVSL